MSAPFMPLYIADYLADTTHLTRSEHGAYMLLLMAMWRAGGKLPSSDDKLSRLAKCTADEWSDMRDVIMEFFKRRGATITHKRLSEEYAKYQNALVRKSEGGKASAAKKAIKNNENPPKILERDFQDNATNQNQNHNIAKAIATGWPENSEIREAALSVCGPGLGDPSKDEGLARTWGAFALWKGSGYDWRMVLQVIAEKTKHPRTKRITSWTWFNNAMSEAAATWIPPAEQKQLTPEQRNACMAHYVKTGEWPVTWGEKPSWAERQAFEANQSKAG